MEMLDFINHLKVLNENNTALHPTYTRNENISEIVWCPCSHGMRQLLKAPAQRSLMNSVSDPH
jgi:hypothetical protein